MTLTGRHFRCTFCFKPNVLYCVRAHNDRKTHIVPPPLPPPLPCCATCQGVESGKLRSLWPRLRPPEHLVEHPAEHPAEHLHQLCHSSGFTKFHKLRKCPKVGQTDAEKLRDILRETFGTLLVSLIHDFVPRYPRCTIPWCCFHLFSHAFLVFAIRRCQSLFVQWLCRQFLACLCLRSETFNFQRLPVATQKKEDKRL